MREEGLWSHNSTTVCRNVDSLFKTRTEKFNGAGAFLVSFRPKIVRPVIDGRLQQLGDRSNTVSKTTSLMTMSEFGQSHFSKRIPKELHDSDQRFAPLMDRTRGKRTDSVHRILKHITHEQASLAAYRMRILVVHCVNAS